MEEFRQASDLQLIELIQQESDSSSEAVEELVARHSGIIQSVVNRYSNVLIETGVFIPDIADNKPDIVWSAAKSFNPIKNCKYSTWLYDLTRFRCLNAIKQRPNIEELTPNTISFISSEESDSKSLELIDIVHKYLENVSDPRVSTIFRMRFFDHNNNGKKYSIKAIAQEIGVSKQQVYNILNFHLRKIKSIIASNEFKSTN